MKTKSCKQYLIKGGRIGLIISIIIILFYVSGGDALISDKMVLFNSSFGLPFGIGIIIGHYIFGCKELGCLIYMGGFGILIYSIFGAIIGWMVYLYKKHVK